MKIITTALFNITHIERRIICALVVALLSLGALYLYSVTASVLNVVIREETGQRITEVNSRLGELETAYINRTNEINLTLARAYGFSEVSERYARRAPLGSTLSVQSESR